MAEPFASLPVPTGVELRVTDALPFNGTNAAGEPLGPVHWFPMHDYVLVSQELFDQLKAQSVTLTGDRKSEA